MKKYALSLLLLVLNTLAVFSQNNIVTLFDFENDEILTRTTPPYIYTFTMGLVTINHEVNKQATAGSQGFVNYYYDNSYTGIHFFSNKFDSSDSTHADWNEYRENAYLTFWINTNDGGPVQPCIGWDNASYGDKYWATRDMLIDTHGEWEKYSIKIQDIVWRDQYGKGAITYPDLTKEPKTLYLVFDDPRIEPASSPRVNLSVDDIEISGEPYTAALKAYACKDVAVVCGGNAQLSATSNYRGTEKLTYLWSPSDGLSAVDIPNPTAKVSSNSKYTVRVTLPDGSSATDSVNVNILPLTMSLSIPVIACGNMTQLTINTNYTGSDELTYKWTPSDGLSADNIQNPFVTLHAPMQYSVQVSTPNGCIADSSFILTPSMIAVQPSICMVTVDDDDKNVVVCQRDQGAAIESFYIYRESVFLTNQYDLIGVISNSVTNVFKDLTSNARIQSNKYKIAIKDECGYMTALSQDHKTMHLMANRGAGNNWNLIWEPYGGAPVSNYQIFRGTSKSDLIQIGTTSGSNISYTDETAPEGDVFYQVAVEVNQSCTQLKSTANNYIRSNIFSSKELSNTTNPLSGAEAFIYPNPATNILNVKTSGSSNTVIAVFDLDGRQIECRQINAASIDVSQLSEGIYTLKIVDAGNVFFSKFVKE